MGTSEEEGSNSPLETQNEEINLETSSDGDNNNDHRNQNPVEDSSIAEQMYNLELQSNVREEEEGGEGEFQNYPFRPNATECAFFIRTGTCKYGLNCRFNHPPRRVFKLAGEEEKGGAEELNEGVFYANLNTECKYFSTPGGCKYGDACRYNHLSEEAGKAYLELNFAGLPIRPTEKECTFYLRTGTCAYGAKCRFNHPDPTAANYLQSRNSITNGYSSRVDNGFPKTNGSMNSSGVVQDTFSNGMNSRNSAPYASNVGSNYQAMPQNHGWNQNQVGVSLPPNKPTLPHQIVDLSKKQDPSTNYERLMQIEEFPERLGQPDCDYFMRTGDCKYRSACRYNHPISRSSKLPLPPFSSQGHYSRSAKMAPAEMDLGNSYSGNVRNNGTRFDNNQQIQNGGFPERPGQPECEYFMKTGSCKFNSACRYHHPKNRVPASSSPCALSDKGLPLRPGAKICRNYEHQGTCQYGIRCLFNHPDNAAQVAAADNQKHPSTSASVSNLESAFSNNVEHPSTSVAVSNPETVFSTKVETNWDDGWVM